MLDLLKPKREKRRDYRIIYMQHIQYIYTHIDDVNGEYVRRRENCDDRKSMICFAILEKINLYTIILYVMWYYRLFINDYVIIFINFINFILFLFDMSHND